MLCFYMHNMTLVTSHVMFSHAIHDVIGRTKKLVTSHFFGTLSISVFKTTVGIIMVLKMDQTCRFNQEPITDPVRF